MLNYLIFYLFDIISSTEHKYFEIDVQTSFCRKTSIVVQLRILPMCSKF